MDRGRRAEPFSNATIWTREIARNLAGHLQRISKAHSCVDNKSPKSTQYPQFNHTVVPKRVGPLSPIKSGQSGLDNEDEGPSNNNLEAESLVSPVVPNIETPCDSHPSPGHRTVCSPLKSGSANARAKALKNSHIKSKRTQLEAEKQEAIAHENQRLLERIQKISTQRQPKVMTDAVNASTGIATNESIYDTINNASKRQDYHKRQEQFKIWQENQALIKRLRNTKTTLSIKKWEQDEKWNQNFLKTQERRRLALQSEMSRTLASPQLALERTKLRLPSDKVENVSPESNDHDAPVEISTETKTETTVINSARGHRRRRPDTEDMPRCRSSAANHRRIMQLRQQKTGSGPRTPSPIKPKFSSTTISNNPVAVPVEEKAESLLKSRVIAEHQSLPVFSDSNPDEVAPVLAKALEDPVEVLSENAVVSHSGWTSNSENEHFSPLFEVATTQRLEVAATIADEEGVPISEVDHAVEGTVSMAPQESIDLDDNEKMSLKQFIVQSTPSVDRLNETTATERENLPNAIEDKKKEEEKLPQSEPDLTPRHDYIETSGYGSEFEADSPKLPTPRLPLNAEDDAEVEYEDDLEISPRPISSVPETNVPIPQDPLDHSYSDDGFTADE